MTIRRFRRRLPGALRLVTPGALALALALGCGPSDEEAAFRDASEELAESRDAVAAAQEAVAEEEAEFAEAEAELAAAREALREAKANLSEAQAAVGRHATDDVLFREIQGRLLEDDALAEVAISARVEKGVVTLAGEAESAEQRERAAEIAESVPGVIGVENRVVVSERGV